MLITDQKTTHELKIWPEYFEAIRVGNKTFEIRENDRDFKEGDVLLLKEYIPVMNEYTERSMKVVVKYIMEGGRFGILPDYVVMSIEIIS